LRSPSLREQFGKAGRKIVETKYSAEVHAPRVYNILRTVTQSADLNEMTLQPSLD
jgi:glycosyltransferase involved in cell wall biosynthesis